MMKWLFLLGCIGLAAGCGSQVGGNGAGDTDTGVNNDRSGGAEGQAYDRGGADRPQPGVPRELVDTNVSTGAGASTGSGAPPMSPSGNAR